MVANDNSFIVAVPRPLDLSCGRRMPFFQES